MFLNNLRVSTPIVLKTVLNITVGTPNKGSSPHVFLTLSSPGGVRGRFNPPPHVVFCA